MYDSHSCPKCKSKKVRMAYPNLICLSCGFSQDLIDYPVSWDRHRHFCREYGQPDPGPCERPQNIAAEIKPKPDIDRNGYARIHQLEAQVKQLSLALSGIYARLSPRDKAAAITRRAHGEDMQVGYGGLKIEKPNA